MMTITAMMRRATTGRVPFVVLLWLLAAIPACADWTAVRDLVRSAERLSDEDRQEQTLRRAYAAAQISVSAAPNSSNEHLWLAIAAGRLGLVASMGECVKLSKVVKEHAERAIALDPANGQAYMLLGVWHFYVADLSWLQRNAAKILYGGVPQASYREAAAYLTKALQHGVENPIEVHYVRGRSYEALGNARQAAADYRACVAIAARSASEREAQQDARDRLE